MGSNNVNFEVDRVSIPEVRPMEKVKPRAPAKETKTHATEAVEKKVEPKKQTVESQQVKNNSVQLVRDEESGRSFVQVMDDRGEILYQIPPEELMKLQQLLKHLNGNVVDTVA
jgi:uncharacterized FlaG/YvyC family protein